jgi:methionyl-tRNA formyltransferase
MDSIKVIFMGTPDFSVPVLDMLINNYNVIGVVTQPDKPVGRKGEIKMSPVKELALKHNIKVYQPIKIRKEYEDIINEQPDIIVTCAYGQIIPKEILDAPRLGCINVHASLLPRHRGGAPIHRAILEGDKETGVTIMYMDVGMDTGDIITSQKIDILDTDTCESLFDKLAILGSNLLKDTLPSIIDGTNKRIKQDDSKATISNNIKPEDEVIDFSKSKRDVFNQIRGLNSWPVAYTYLDNKRFKVWLSREGNDKITGSPVGTIVNIYKDGIGVQVSDGEIVLTEIQPEGKKKMLASSYINGIKKEELLGKKLGEV